MTMRAIQSAERTARTTRIILDCGHARSIGGHVWHDGTPVAQPSALLGQPYECRDGHCVWKGRG